MIAETTMRDPFGIVLAAEIVLLIFAVALASKGHWAAAGVAAILALVTHGLTYHRWKSRDRLRRAALDIAVQRALDSAAAAGQKGFSADVAFAEFQTLGSVHGIQVGDPRLGGSDVAELRAWLQRAAAFAAEHGAAPSAARPGSALLPRSPAG